MAKILNFGSLNIDRVYSVKNIVREGETIASSSLNSFPGGKGLNQSIALSRAGAEVYMAGGLGRGSEQLLEMMVENRVDVSLLEKRDVESGHAIIQVDEDGRNCIVIFHGSNFGNTEKYIKRVISNFSEGDYLVLQNEIDGLAEIIEAAWQQKLKIVLNPSPINAKLLALDMNKIDILILNEHEAKAILESDPNRNAHDHYSSLNGEVLIDLLHRQFPEALIVLTMGEEGSLLCDADARLIYQTAYKTQVVDTTAAGDTFTGYFLAALIAGKEYKEALEKASIASALSVSRVGASPSIPFFQEVETLYEMLFI
ncbi:MAG: ribokinase [Eubacteriales bacterium]|nr:ribokinase [Eubacteriales bacterium]